MEVGMGLFSYEGRGGVKEFCRPGDLSAAANGKTCYFPSMKQSPGTLWPRILVVGLTVLLAVAVADRVMKLTPPRYLSTVTMQIRNPDAAKPALDLETTRELILRREVLEPVVKSLGLAGNDPVMALRRSVSVEGLRDTALVRISVTADTPVEAARRANAVAEEFQRREIEGQRKQAEHRLEQLEAEVAAQREIAALRETAVDAIRREAGYPDFPPEAGELKTLGEAVGVLKTETATLKARADQLAALTDEQVLKEISEGTEFGKSLDPTLTALTVELQNVEAEEAKITDANDPRLEALRGKKALLEKQRNGLVRVLRGRVWKQAANAQENLLAVERSMAASPHQPSKEIVEKYRAAKQDYMQQRKILEAVEGKRATALVTIPAAPVVIWERAEPPSHPDSRPRVLAAVAVLLGLVAGSGLAALPRPGIVAGGVAALLVVTLAIRFFTPHA